MVTEEATLDPPMNPTVPYRLIRDLPRHVGEEVTLRGWLYGQRSGGKILFLQVRDGTGLCQCVVEAGQTEAFRTASALTQESSLHLAGSVRAEPRAPGGVELRVTALTVVHTAEPYPIARKAHGVEFLMQHRHLWLRARRQTAILRIRHTIVQSIRNYFDEQGFTLIDTPILVGGAAEGAGTLFPVEYFDERAYLTQTGQLHLECACMALGKVYCFGPTFRAEKSKTRRHLTEFWMVEPEIAFADLNDVMALAEGLVVRLVAAVRERHADDLALLGRDPAPLAHVAPPFPRITYADAIAILRSPETHARLERELEADRQQLRRHMAELQTLEAQHAGGGKAWQQEQRADRLRELRETIHDLEQDLVARPGHIAQAQQFAWGKDLGGSDETILSRHFDRPVFVTEYPKEVKAFYMKRRTPEARVVQNVDLLAPEGYGEIVGGSQREDDLALLLDRMRAEGLRPEDYGWYVDLRRYGSVPHGGFGLGIERSVAWLCGLPHVRETIPFPRLMGRLTP